MAELAQFVVLTHGTCDTSHSSIVGNDRIDGSFEFRNEAFRRHPVGFRVIWAMAHNEGALRPCCRNLGPFFIRISSKSLLNKSLWWDALRPQDDNLYKNDQKCRYAPWLLHCFWCPVVDILLTAGRGSGLWMPCSSISISAGIHRIAGWQVCSLPCCNSSWPLVIVQPTTRPTTTQSAIQPQCCFHNWHESGSSWPSVLYWLSMPQRPFGSTLLLLALWRFVSPIWENSIGSRPSEPQRQVCHKGVLRWKTCWTCCLVWLRSFASLLGPSRWRRPWWQTSLCRPNFWPKQVSNYIGCLCWLSPKSSSRLRRHKWRHMKTRYMQFHRPSWPCHYPLG